MGYDERLFRPVAFVFMPCGRGAPANIDMCLCKHLWGRTAPGLTIDRE